VRSEPRLPHFDISGSDWGVRDVPAWAEYHIVSCEADYAAALGALDSWLDRTDPGIVFYQAGMDCYTGDPLGGIEGVDAPFLQWRDRTVIRSVISRGIPLVINLAGGYLEDGTTERLHVETVRAAIAELEGA
jgi:acetoin utilization deacetylase AcuC-like enzyme